MNSPKARRPFVSPNLKCALITFLSVPMWHLCLFGFNQPPDNASHQETILLILSMLTAVPVSLLNGMYIAPLLTMRGQTLYSKPFTFLTVIFIYPFTLISLICGLYYLGLNVRHLLFPLSFLVSIVLAVPMVIGAAYFAIRVHLTHKGIPG